MSEAILKAGQLIGLKGEDLKEFIQQESESQIELERLKLMRFEVESKEAILSEQRAQESEKRAQDAEARNERAENRAIQKLEMEQKTILEEVRSQELENQRVDRTSPADSSKARVPKLPFFTEKD